MNKPYRIDFIIEGLPSTPNARRHHMNKYREDQSWYISIRAAVGAGRPVAPLERANLTLTRISTVEPDYDNLVASFKPVIDGLRFAEVLTDDKKKNIGTPDYRWERGKPGKGCVRITVEAVT